MSPFQIIQESIRIIRANVTVKSFGIFAIINAVLSMLYAFLPSRQYVLSYPPLIVIRLLCLGAIIVLTEIVLGGLIYVSYQMALDRKVTFIEGWSRGKSSALRNIGLMALVLPAVFFVFGVLILPFSRVFWLIALLILDILGAFLSFSTYTVIIDDAKFVNAIRTGFLFTLKKIVYASILIWIFSLIQLLPTGILILFFSGSAYRAILPHSLTFDYSTYVQLLGVPIIGWTYRITGWFILPWSTVAWVIFYNKITTEISLPAVLVGVSTIAKTETKTPPIRP